MTTSSIRDQPAEGRIRLDGAQMLLQKAGEVGSNTNVATAGLRLLCGTNHSAFLRCAFGESVPDLAEVGDHLDVGVVEVPEHGALNANCLVLPQL